MKTHAYGKSQTLFYISPNPDIERFKKCFGHLGTVVVRI